MKRTLLLGAFLMVLLTALNAFFQQSSATAADVPENVRAVIHVTDTGELVFLDAKGGKLEPCVLPGPDGAAPAGGTVCKGMGKDSAVTGIMALPIIKTNSTHCITLGPDASGQYYQICW